ncbi:FG-GAP-like repeat-containing protein [Dysgonomonas mossii]|uniref:FG-GAP-like repeat-containing protein n=1 Tax=Dysgonomonas mossii TaxID=163665 RepID=UPI0039920315
MKTFRMKIHLMVLCLFLGIAVELDAQIVFPEFSNITPSEIPQIFRGNFVWGDYNNDGRLDLLTLGRDDSWNRHGFLLNNTASGNFKNIIDLGNFGVNVGDSYNSVFAWIDFNNDGNLDFLQMGTRWWELSTSSNDLFLNLYENKGEKGAYKFELVKNTNLKGVFPEQENQYANALVVGDYDNDGYQDIMAVGFREGKRQAYLFRNINGTGQFELKSNIVDGGNFNEVSIGGAVFADLNNDGYLDIILNGKEQNSDNGFSAIYLNKGNGTFTKTTWTDDISSSGKNQAGQTFVGDFNNDGFLDIITTGERTEPDPVGWTVNTNMYLHQSQTATNISYIEKLDSSIGVTPIKKGGGDAADLNADGLLDFILSGESKAGEKISSIYMNKGDGTFDNQSEKIDGVRSGAVAALADIDNDGYLDVTVMGGWGPVLRLWKNNGNLAKNTKPTAPSNLQATYSDGKITFTWDAGSDMETPQKALRYNLYLKNFVGQIMTVIPADTVTGYLKISDISTAINTTSYTLNIPLHDYEWGVQTIDQGKQASEFAKSTITVESKVLVSEGKWELKYYRKSGTLDYINNGNTILNGVFAQAKTGNTILKSSDYNEPAVSKENITDDFGSGVKYTLSYTGLATAPDLRQIFYFYSGKDYFLTEVFVESLSSISSNYIAPIVTNTTSAFLPEDKSNRVLSIPFDNDGFVRYGSYPLAIDSVSFEVTSIFNGAQRNGIVIGSVEHDVWKTGVRYSASAYKNITKLECFGGITHRLTRDIGDDHRTAHGSISGTSLKSPKMLFGYFDDWRKGMDEYASANAIIAPPRKWEKGVPFGWNSWSAMAGNVNYEGATDVSDFIKEQLKPKSFDNDVVYIGLDSYWKENFTEQQLINFVKYCKANGQEAGIYMTPFSNWWGDDTEMAGTNGRYRFKDAYLYSNGKALGNALDPTHPGTKMLMKYNIDRFKQWGFKYIKLDFINSGIKEADSYYESGITTGVQAYNHGMQYLVDLCGDDIFLAESIAPTFPAQYAHSKRISCDAWGDIGNSEYMLNSLSFGWWLDKVYAFNDPDHLALHDRESRNLYSEGENRARITSGVITGLYMLGNNTSLRGSYLGKQTIRDRELKMLTNKDINSIAKIKKSFYPVEGHKASGYDKSENLFMLTEGKHTYIAVFNFDGNSLSGTIDFSRLGVTIKQGTEIKELWTGTYVDVTGGSLSYSVPSKDVRVYRIGERVIYAPEIVKNPKSTGVLVNGSATFLVEASGELMSYQWYKDGNIVEGAISDNLTISNITSSNVGEYYCIVSNPTGSVATDKAKLTILTNELDLTDVVINSNQWKIADKYVLYSASDDVVTIEIPVPEWAKVVYKGSEAPDNIIKVRIDKPQVVKVPFTLVWNLNETITKEYTLELEKYFAFDKLVVKRWNNTLIANNNYTTNGGFIFSDYKWFKDDVLVSSKASYSAGSKKDMLLDTNARYYLQVTTTDNVVLRTDESKITHTSGVQINAYPNPIDRNQPMAVLVDLGEDQMKNAVIEIYNINGNRVKTQKVEGIENQITAPQESGIYLIKVRSNNFVQSQKIVVK